MSFVDEDNLCGQQLLKLVARGSSIIAEMYRLSAHIPPVFLGDKRNEYAGLIFDYSYLEASNGEKYENEIIANGLLEKDEEFRETHMQILHRFFQLFESIWKYITDLLKFWENIQDGQYVQQTFESILVDSEGKQLMAEALYLYGVMLLQLDQRIEGKVRERMLISYLRYKGSGEISNLTDVCRLCRSTGSSKKPYPEEYFGRIPIPGQVVDMIIGRLRSDDIYLMSYNFPLPEHRSAALATQAGMLYVLLFFRPQILHESKPIMREIVDRHFPDNWIISYYMGNTVDLTHAWAHFPAASKCISETSRPENMQYYQKNHARKLRELNKKLDEYLREGVLNETFVLDNIHSKLLPCIRDCNATLRWLSLHETCTDKRLKPTIMQDVDRESILMLLLNTSQLEYLLTKMFSELLKKQADKWEECKTIGQAKMDQLSKFFAGEGVLASETKEEGLAEWFSEIGERIEELEYSESVQAGRKIQSLITALMGVEEYHQVDSNMQVKQFLLDTRGLLKTMIRYVNVEEKVNITVSTVGDFSYGWRLIAEYVPMMQEKIKKSPSLVMQLRSCFLKLASMMELPLTRIHQARSEDLVSVGEYYSTQLVSFVRRVLNIIPSSMFEELQRVISILTNSLKECPTRIPRDQLKDYSQLEERHQLALTTFQISKFTEGILAMEKTLMGVIEIKPQQLLEDGIRKELVHKLAVILHNGLQFPQEKNSPGFEERLGMLSKKLEGMRNAFEYIQDYVNVSGLKLWQEEFSRLINFNVEMECNLYLTKRIYDWQSRFQSESIPIPRFPQIEGDRNINFMGRLVQELLRQTDSRKTFYVDQLSGWYNDKGVSVVSLQTFTLLHSAISTPGMAGVDRLLCFMIVKDLQNLVIKGIKRDLMKDMQSFLDSMGSHFSPPSMLPREARQWYQKADELGKRYWPAFLDTLVRVGRCQLLRKHIGKELRFACKLDSASLYDALSTLNRALVKDVQAHYSDPVNKRYPNGRKPILNELTAYLDNCGMSDPFTKIYITMDPVPQITLVLLVFVVAHLPRFQYDSQVDSLLVRRGANDVLDGVPFVVGTLTVLQQFHSDHKNAFVAYLCQYCRVTMNELEVTQKKVKEKDREVIPFEICNCLHFLEFFCKVAAVDRKLLENLLPPYLLAKYKEFSKPPKK
eukprot:Sspe_Gene.70274::Locus_41488_Transcript_1_1_Confidence_1.000_Length_3743::g.70274::m.70274/K18464/RTSC, SPG8; WASH complex subunit strumpellin